MSSFDQLQDVYKNLDGRANNVAQVLKTPYVAALLHIVFIGYASNFATKIPVRYHWLFTNPAMRIAVLSLVLLSSSNNFAFSLSVMSAYILLAYTLNKRYEGFTGFRTAIYPGCTNLTQADLLEAFSGDVSELMNAMQNSLVPFNIVVNDENAPLIGTYLMNHNYKLKLPCAPPGTK